MQIPAFFATYREEGLMATDGRFTGIRAVPGNSLRPFGEAAREGTVKEMRAPAVVVDCDSLAARAFTEGVLKHMRIRGADIWFMTHIETVEDVFDGFNTDAEMLLAPLHDIASEEELEDIHSVSDSVIPALFVKRGTVVAGPRRREVLTDVLNGLADMGFYRTCIIDTDRSLPGYDWEAVRDDYPSAMPFTEDRRILDMGFANAVVPFRPGSL